MMFHAMVCIGGTSRSVDRDSNSSCELLSNLIDEMISNGVSAAESISVVIVRIPMLKEVWSAASETVAEEQRAERRIMKERRQGGNE